MLAALIELALFTAKTLIILAFILIVLIAFFSLLAKSKDKLKGQLLIKNLNKKYAETTETVLTEILPAKAFKKYLKDKKKKDKTDKKADQLSNVYVLTFHGDIKASGTANLAEEINAVIAIADKKDEVVLRLESAGGMVHAYGLAAAQLMRLKEKNIPLTITIDKIAASGGYMMASIANKILAAPFAIIGSIGVVVQLPNFHRLLKDKHVDFEMHTAGEFKRTLTVFGQNTPEGRAKLQEEIEDIHQQFKQLIQANRKELDIQKVSTGEHWLGQQALTLRLVDEIKTSDAYLLERSKDANLYELTYEIKKPFMSRLSATARVLRDKYFPY